MTGSLIWTGIAIAAALALWAWLWPRPRIRHLSTDERVRAADEEQWQDQALDVVAERCCDLHNRNCEPPYELCCEDCTEAEHPRHRTTDCIAPDLSAGFDVIAEPDRRRAEHMKGQEGLRRAEGGHEHE